MARTFFPVVKLRVKGRVPFLSEEDLGDPGDSPLPSLSGKLSTTLLRFSLYIILPQSHTLVVSLNDIGFFLVGNPLSFIMAGLKNPKYSALSAEPEKAERTSSEDDSSQSDGLLGNVVYQKTRPRRVYGAVTIVGAICALLLSAVGAFVLGTRWRPNLNRQCLEHTSYSCASHLSQWGTSPEELC